MSARALRAAGGTSSIEGPLDWDSPMSSTMLKPIRVLIVASPALRDGCGCWPWAGGGAACGVGCVVWTEFCAAMVESTAAKNAEVIVMESSLEERSPD